MIKPGASLSSMVATVVAVVLALALTTAAALVLLTTELRRSSEDLRTVLESVRLADDAAIQLLLHTRIVDPLTRSEVERGLVQELERARAFARSDDQRGALAAATARVSAYLAGGQEGTAPRVLEEAFAALEALVATNVREAHRAALRAERLDRLGNWIGAGIAVLLVAVAAWLLWWLRRRTFEPLLALAGAMERFGGGEASARAPETGPAELRAMARSFNAMAAALGALRRREMTYLAGLAHELRTPLSALKLAAAREREEVPGATLALVRRQVLRLERQVSDFLDTARIEAGQLDVHPQRVDLRDVVENVAALFGPTTSTHEIRVRVPEEQVVAACDPGRLEQVLNNLVSNAIKYSPRGGHIDLRLEPHPEAVRVVVADEGVGIPDGEIESIFEPFRRGRNVEPEITGVGLGLYVSRRIVEAHGGQLLVRSAPGRGATFQVVLPR